MPAQGCMHPTEALIAGGITLPAMRQAMQSAALAEAASNLRRPGSSFGASTSQSMRLCETGREAGSQPGMAGAEARTARVDIFRNEAEDACGRPDSARLSTQGHAVVRGMCMM